MPSHASLPKTRSLAPANPPQAEACAANLGFSGLSFFGRPGSVLRLHWNFSNLRMFLFAILPYKKNNPAKEQKRKPQNNNHVQFHYVVPFPPCALDSLSRVAATRAKNNPPKSVLGSKEDTRPVPEAGHYLRTCE
jgi:hypothetical protein